MSHMRKVYSTAQQLLVILRELRLSHPGVTLPGGHYGMKDRPLEKVCNFLESEVQGLMSDTDFVPAAGAPQSREAPDGQD